MSANTETTGGPPKGYVECSEKCGRWTNSGKCWTCCARLDGHPEEVYVSRDTPDWTPPIAAPAAHIERRKGQRWRMRNVMLGADFSGVLAEDTGATWKLSDVVAMDGKGTDRRFRADMWATPDTTMTLLADAPSEPAMGVPHPKGCRCKQCEQPIKYEAPPAHEAPKAAPVCDIARDTHAGPVLMRWIRAGKGAKPSLTPACEQCHVLSERAGRFGGVFPASILHDKDVPTRLPRPQLAADWVEDCLPESDR